MNITTKIKLNNGLEIPQLGLGVYQTKPGEETQNAVLWALETGYRHIDTARIYGNEIDVGKAIRKSMIPREEIFVTTKLWNADHGFVQTIRACVNSLRDLEMEYIDLFLIHWPVQYKRNESWKAMETLITQGKVKSIGVSNYTKKHVDECLADASVIPAINQVEFHPFLYQKDLMEYCLSKSIHMEAYSPLTRGEKFDSPELIQLSEKYSKSKAQILIRWGLQHGLIVLPKSSKKERIKENACVFDFFLNDEDMNILDSLNENFRTCWDPTTAP